jgi:hypothetical protein
MERFPTYGKKEEDKENEECKENEKLGGKGERW